MNDYCENCSTRVSYKVMRYSFNRFGQVLCMGCQLKAREKDTPPKLAEFINNQIKEKYTIPHCPKCGDPVKGDTDGLCSYCV